MKKREHLQHLHTEAGLHQIMHRVLKWSKSMINQIVLPLIQLLWLLRNNKFSKKRKKFRLLIKWIWKNFSLIKANNKQSKQLTRRKRGRLMNILTYIRQGQESSNVNFVQQSLTRRRHWVVTKVRNIQEWVNSTSTRK